MKVKHALFSFLFLSPLPLFAHQIPVAPVYIQFHVESDQVRAHITMESDYWMAEVLGLSSPPPPSGWAPEFQAASARVIDESMSLAVDGVGLQRESLACRFVEEPLGLVSSRFEFDAVYAMPQEGRALSGRIQFFQDEYHHYVAAQRPVEQSFISYVRFSGRDQVRVDLPFDNPEFQFDLAGLRKTAREYFTETFRSSVLYLLFNSLFPFCGLSAFLAVRAGRTRDAFFAAGTLMIVAAAFIWGGRPSAFGPSVLWGIVGLLYLPKIVTGRFAKADVVVSVAGCGAVWPSLVALNTMRLPFSLDASPSIRPAVFAAFIASGLACSAVFSVVEMLRQRALKKGYGETAPRLFQFDVRALSGFLVFFAAMQMIKFQILK